MKVRWTRCCVAFLFLFIPLHLASCSSSQQQDDWEMGEGFDNEWNDEHNEWGNEDGEWNNEYNEWGNEDGEWNNEYNDWNDNFDDFDSAGTDFDNTFDNFLGDDGFGDEYAFNDANNDLSSILAEMDQTDDRMGGIIDADPGYNQPQMGTGFGNLTEVDQGIDPGYADMPMNQAPVASASPALPEYGSKMPYVVERGDTLAKIATKIYGNSARWREMADLSSLANPSRIYPGDIVYYQLTEESMNFATVYESLPRQEVVVNVGDTLSTIAGRVFGDSTNWKAIWRQNDNISNPDRLEAGMVLHYILPGSLMAALGQDSGAVVAVQDVSVDTVEIAQVNIETTPEKGMTNMMAMVTKALNVNLMA